MPPTAVQKICLSKSTPIRSEIKPKEINRYSCYHIHECLAKQVLDSTRMPYPPPFAMSDESFYIQSVNKDWYQTAVENLKIDEIPYENFGKKKRIGHGGSGLVFKTTCKSTPIRDEIKPPPKYAIPKHDPISFTTFVMSDESFYIQSVNKDWFQTAVESLKIDEIPYENFGKKKRIGHGGSGLVFKTTCESKGTVAIKEVNIADDDKICTKLFINELKILRRVNDERIVGFYGVSRNVEDSLYYIVLEYANQGDLREFLKNGLFEWKEKIRLATQIAEGVRYLHEKNIAHRDLHTKNILVGDGNAKISDFGWSKNLDSLTSNKTIGVLPFIDRRKLIDEANFVLDQRSDIYSLGMILWEISSCRAPFLYEDSAFLFYKICQGLQEKPVNGTPIEYVRLYTSCWFFEPDSRPLSHQVLSQLQTISLESVFGDYDDDLNEIPTNFRLLPDNLKNFNHDYSNQISLNSANVSTK